MQEKHLFEYAVLRIVPHVEREEFLNAGVVLFCAKEKFLRTVYEVNEKRLHSLCKQLDMEELKSHFASFERICRGGKEAGTIGQLSLAERFRWLTATRSTIVQTSRVHPGLCDNASEMLERLFEQLVRSDC